MSVHADTLDPAVDRASRALEALGFPAPRALFLLATGVGFLPERLSGAQRLDLSEVDGVPAPWRHAQLIAGQLLGLDLWLLDDLSGEAMAMADAPPWVRGFPAWLAAARGARVLVCAAAGAALSATDGSTAGLQPGDLALVRDHINLSGRTPLLGLGPSKCGPLFPDPSRLHDGALRQAALRAGAKLGLDLREVVVAATSGPSLDTAAERRFYARAGADVAVQNLESPLIAAAHAGLVALAIVAITDAGEGRADLRRLLERSSDAAPALEDLLVAIAPAVDAAVRAFESEERP